MCKTLDSIHQYLPLPKKDHLESQKASQRRSECISNKSIQKVLTSRICKEILQAYKEQITLKMGGKLKRHFVAKDIQ
jgi:hypothetical protein